MTEDKIVIDGVELEVDDVDIADDGRWYRFRPKRKQKQVLRIVTTIPGYPDLGVDESITLPPDAKVYLDGKVVE